VILRLVRAEEIGSNGILLVSRDQQGNRRVVRINDYYPYLYVPADENVSVPYRLVEQVDYRSIEGKPVKKVVFSSPKDLKKHREKFRVTYEGNIQYVRRFCIDRGIRGYFWIPLEKGGRFLTLPYRDVVGVNPSSEIPLRIAVMDLERHYKTEEIISASLVLRNGGDVKYYLFGPKVDTFYSYAMDDWVRVTSIPTKSEEELLSKLIDTMAREEVDILTGWGVRKFDYRWLYERARANKLRLERVSPIARITPQEIGGIQIFDLLSGTRKLKGELRSYKLVRVAKELGIELPHYTYKEIAELPPSKLGVYNLLHSDACLAIDQKLGVLTYFQNLADLAGVTLEEAMINSIVVDSMLFYYKPEGVVLPTYSEKEPEEVEGAIVFEPKPGLWENVAVVDIGKTYPSIIIAYNIGGEVLARPLRELMKLREEYEAKGLKDKIAPLKTVINSFYGVLGTSGFRLYDPKLQGKITSIARDLLGVVKVVAERMGYPVLYGDSITGDTPVVIRKWGKFVDVVPIEDLFPKTTAVRYFGIPKEIEVLTRDGWKHPLYLYRRKCRKQLYAVVLGNGLTKVTEDHSLFSKGVEITPKALRRGDEVDEVEFNLPSNTEIPPELAWVLGLFCAEGSCGAYPSKYGTKYTWAINNKDISLLLRAKEILERYFAIPFVILDTLKSSNCYKLVPVGNIKRMVEYFEVCYTRVSREKKVPMIILNARKEAKEAFIEGYFEGDGCLDPSGYRTYTTVSFTLARGLELLLKSLGREVGVKYRVKEPRDSIILYEIKNPDDPRYFRNRVKRIIPIKGTEYVYDIGFLDGHTFVAGLGSIVHHNTDSVMLKIPRLAPEEVTFLIEEANEEFDKYCEKTGGRTGVIRIKLEKLYSKFLLSRRKKRYAGLVVWEGEWVNPPRLEIKGFEVKRSDSAEVTLRAEEAVFRMLLDGLDPRKYLTTLISQIEAGKVSPIEVAFPSRLVKKPEDYKVQSIHVKAVDYSNRYLGTDFGYGDRFYYLHVKRMPNGYPPTEVIAIDEDTELPRGIVIDWERHAEKAIVDKLKPVLEDLGLDASYLDKQSKITMYL
jgi:DNA polymerase elongation subunit (family B)